ncbi:MAG: multi-sensor signal transduction histidine kinase BphP, partial [Pseudomonadota bacterium]
MAQVWRQWWRKQSPSHQDRYALMGPLIAVVLFLTAITTAFWYLKSEELEREQELVRRDVEYAQQRLRLRLIERQEQLLRMARDIATGDTTVGEFPAEAASLLNQTPEITNISWLDTQQRVRATYNSGSAAPAEIHLKNEWLTHPETKSTFTLTRDLKQPVYSQPLSYQTNKNNTHTLLQLQVPIVNHSKFEGVVMAEMSLEGILRYAVPDEVSRKYAVSLRDSGNNVLAGQANKSRPKVSEVLPWLSQRNDYEVPITPIGYALTLHAQT